MLWKSQVGCSCCFGRSDHGPQPSCGELWTLSSVQGSLGPAGRSLALPKSSNCRACEMQWEFQVCENKLYLHREAFWVESCRVQLALLLIHCCCHLGTHLSLSWQMHPWLLAILSPSHIFLGLLPFLCPFCPLVAAALQRSARPMLLIKSHLECSLWGWNVDWPLTHLEGLGWVVSCGHAWVSVLVAEMFQGHLSRHPVGLCLALKPFISSQRPEGPDLCYPCMN